MKKFFNTPKKAVISTICIAAVIVAIAAVVSVIVLKNTTIGRAEATKVALNDAGLSDADVSGLRTEFDLEDGHFQYEIDFYSNGTEYEYVIQAKDGGIISRDIDVDKSNVYGKDTSNQLNVSSTLAQKVQANSLYVSSTQTKSESVASTAVSEQAALISVNEAQETVLKDANLTKSEVTFTKIELDKDKSVQVYEIEFYTAEAEYDYEINAFDATIRKMNIDFFKIQTGLGNGVNSSDTYIGIDRAKEIAVNHAGVAETEVTFSKAKLENDDGRVEYEVVFYLGIAEYSYNIDAVSGEIIEYSFEQK